ncbi:hypothetical protein FXO37_35493 [Capsicum annuum]|nr:hypothetical protein FXO37_35493 [Capsicum annuum]
MLRRAKQPPNKNKKKRCRGNDYDDVIKEERKGKHVHLMPSLDDNYGDSKEPEKKSTYANTSMPDTDCGLGLCDQSGVLPEGLIKEKTGSSLSSSWSKEDEITILKGLVRLKTENEIKSRKIDYIALYESIKQFLHRESDIEDLKKKVKCLREKYKKNLKKAKTPSVPHEEELFHLSDKFWGDGDKDHEINQQITCHSSAPSCSSIRPYKSLDLEASDKIFVGDLGLALATINRNQSNPVHVALEQYKLVSQSLRIRKCYGNQILEARITPKMEELSELEEQKIARSYFDTKIQHALLVLDAYKASNGFGVDRDGYGVSVLNGIGGVGYGTKLTFQSTALYAGNARWITDERKIKNSLINVATDCGLKKDTPKAMNEGNSPPATIGGHTPITGKPSNTSSKSVSQMCQSQEREKNKEMNIKNRENQCDSSIPSHTVASSKEIKESATSLPDGMTVEVLVKGKPDGKVASTGKQVEIYFDAKLRDTGCFIGSNIAAGTPHKFCLGLSLLSHTHTALPGSNAKPPILPDSWLQFIVLGTGKGWEVSSEDCTWKNKEQEGVIHDFPFSYYANSAWSAIILLMNEELNDSSYV